MFLLIAIVLWATASALVAVLVGRMIEHLRGADLAEEVSAFLRRQVASRRSRAPAFAAASAVLVVGALMLLAMVRQPGLDPWQVSVHVPGTRTTDTEATGAAGNADTGSPASGSPATVAAAPSPGTSSTVRARDRLRSGDSITPSQHEFLVAIGVPDTTPPRPDSRTTGTTLSDDGSPPATTPPRKQDDGGDGKDGGTKDDKAADAGSTGPTATSTPSTSTTSTTSTSTTSTSAPVSGASAPSSTTTTTRPRRSGDDGDRRSPTTSSTTSPPTTWGSGR